MAELPYGSKVAYGGAPSRPQPGGAGGIATTTLLADGSRASPAAAAASASSSAPSSAPARGGGGGGGGDRAATSSVPGGAPFLGAAPFVPSSSPAPSAPPADASSTIVDDGLGGGGGGGYDGTGFDYGQPDRFGEKFVPRGAPCRDAFWALLFGLQLAFVLVLLVWGNMMSPPESQACQVVGDVVVGAAADSFTPNLAAAAAAADAGVSSSEPASSSSSSSVPPPSPPPCDPTQAVEREVSAWGLQGDKGRRVIGVAFVCALAGGVLSFLYLVAVRRYAKALIWGSLIVNILMWFGLAVILFARGSLMSALIVGVMAMIWGLFAFWWRHRIPFAVAMLKAVASTLDAYPAPIYVAWGSLPVQLVWFVAWVSTLAAAERLQWISSYVFWILMLVSLYWVAQVIKNIVHVTAAGTFASWYFYSRRSAMADGSDGPVTGMPPNPTLGALRRASTTSLGSICLGSLIVAILQTMKTLARMLRNDRSGNALFRILACCCECVLGLVERLLKYFNLYAFSLVAIYGFSYWRAARETMQLITSHGIEAIINDDLITPVLGVGAIAGGLITAGVGAAAAFLFDLPGEGGSLSVVMLAGMGFIIGYIMLIVSMSVVESGVATTFVCFAMDPEALRRNNPHLYHRFTTTYRLY